MDKSDKKLKIELDGIFARQVRQLADIMNISPDHVIQMSIVQFTSSPFATNFNFNSNYEMFRPSNQSDMKDIGLTKQAFHDEEDPQQNKIFEAIDEISTTGLHPDRSHFSFLLSDNIDFDSIRVGSSVQPEKDYFLWGQFSRFLPIKFTLRVLAWCEMENGGPVSINDWSRAVRRFAPNYREVLRDFDLAYGSRRGEQRTSGFPKETEKSLERFTRHFCADIYSDGKMVGLPSHLGLITNDEFGIIQFTPEGLAYVEALNPLIDLVDYEGNSIGPREETLLLERLRNHLPSEWKFMIQVRDWIDEGFNTPTLLEGKIKQNYGVGTSTDWNEKQIPTYRGGVIGRLGELSLITRQWKFRSVTYQKSGEQFLQEVHNGGKS